MSRIASAVLLGAAFSSCAVAQERPAAEAAVQQTLVGRWEWTNPEKKCRETMEFRPNGEVALYSGPGRFDGTYEMSPRPSARGLYRLVMKTPKTAEKHKDCSGSDEALPEVESGYVWIDASKEMFMFCEDDSFSYCTAPLRRSR
ncbi:MAG TPA: hypothetical protein VMU46_14335 [Burkholderiales bacterium]|nr:hypothetical protein [Burkholderiales bacterium]